MNKGLHCIGSRSGRGEGGAGAFCRLINILTLPRSTHHDLNKSTILYKTFIDWVSNESVGFPPFTFVVCVTNFVAAGFHLKDRSLTHLSLYRQLQTSWLDMFRQFVWVVI